MGGSALSQASARDIRHLENCRQDVRESLTGVHKGALDARVGPSPPLMGELGGGSARAFFENQEQVIKLQRAIGGCLGAESRRRAWRTTIRPGEPRAGTDPGIPEWGNPPTVMGGNRTRAGATGGTETSQYPVEEKATAIPLVVASEQGSA
jgi:hypothetical protein